MSYPYRDDYSWPRLYIRGLNMSTRIKRVHTWMVQRPPSAYHVNPRAHYFYLCLGITKSVATALDVWPWDLLSVPSYTRHSILIQGCTENTSAPLEKMNQMWIALLIFLTYHYTHFRLYHSDSDVIYRCHIDCNSVTSWIWYIYISIILCYLDS